MLIVTSIVRAETLLISEPKVEDRIITVSILLEGNGDSSEVSAIDFHLDYDPSVLSVNSVSVGESSREAGKQVMSNLLAPGDFIVVVMGMNREVLDSGEVVTVSFEQLSSPEQGFSEISVASQTLSTFEGVPIPSQGSSMRLILGSDERQETNDEESDSEASGLKPEKEARLLEVSTGLTGDTNPGRLDSGYVFPQEADKKPDEQKRDYRPPVRKDIRNGSSANTSRRQLIEYDSPRHVKDVIIGDEGGDSKTNHIQEITDANRENVSIVTFENSADEVSEDQILTESKLDEGGRFWSDRLVMIALILLLVFIAGLLIFRKGFFS